MSFIDLLSNDKWTEADIVRRTEAMVHSAVPLADEVVLNRKVTAQMLGQWTLTDEELAELQTYSAACMVAHQAGIDARADWAKLESVMAYEAALARLALPEVTEPLMIKVTDQAGVTTTVPNPAIELDAQERAAAQIAVDGATEDTLALFALRHPPEPEPELEPEPEPIE